MKLTYDPRYNIAYLRLREQGEQVETIRISDELNIDIAPDGTVYGIELLNANDRLGAGCIRVQVGHDARLRGEDIWPVIQLYRSRVLVDTSGGGSAHAPDQG